MWTVKHGKEKALIAEWTRFAQWTAKSYPGAGTATLLQDSDNPRRFISFGQWENSATIKAWRERPEFKESVSRIRELCEDFQPQSLVAVATSADECSDARVGNNSTKPRSLRRCHKQHMIRKRE
ncbi:MAG: antibiotic biosynthesis monooxygenase family protein [Bacteroidota bacterium]